MMGGNRALLFIPDEIRAIKGMSIEPKELWCTEDAFRKGSPERKQFEEDVGEAVAEELGLDSTQSLLRPLR